MELTISMLLLHKGLVLGFLVVVFGVLLHLLSNGRTVFCSILDNSYRFVLDVSKVGVWYVVKALLWCTSCLIICLVNHL